MNHIIIGTRAQAIKMAPVMKELDSRGIRYNFIDTGQHITGYLLDLFGIRKPDFLLNDKDITNFSQAFLWNIKNTLKLTLHRSKYFRDMNGLCLIRGDTLTTLQGLIAGKFSGLRVAHIESGLRTRNVFEPFPEEIIRRIADRNSDILFVPSKEAHDNLIKENVKGQIINTKANTVLDSIRMALEKNNEIEIPFSDYILVTIHRVENIYSRKRMKFIMRVLEKISKDEKILFILHKPTKEKLASYGLLSRLKKNKNIHILSIQDYFCFIKLIKNSKYLITDGGGPQEESYYLDTPCLLMRKKTERRSHPNVLLSEFNQAKVNYFIENYDRFKHNSDLLKKYKPSKIIVDYIEKYS